MVVLRSWRRSTNHLCVSVRMDFCFVQQTFCSVLCSVFCLHVVRLVHACAIVGVLSVVFDVPSFS